MARINWHELSDRDLRGQLPDLEVEKIYERVAIYDREQLLETLGLVPEAESYALRFLGESPNKSIAEQLKARRIRNILFQDCGQDAFILGSWDEGFGMVISHDKDRPDDLPLTAGHEIAHTFALTGEGKPCTGKAFEIWAEAFGHLWADHWGNRKAFEKFWNSRTGTQRGGWVWSTRQDFSKSTDRREAVFGDL